MSILQDHQEDLFTIRDEIARDVDFLKTSQTSCLAIEMRIGARLVDAKKMLGYGRFMKWADEAVEAKRSWRAVLMRLALAAPDLAEARKWAEQNGIAAESTPRGQLALVKKWRAGTGEGVPSKPATKKASLKELLRAANDENQGLRRALDQAAEQYAKNAALIADLRGRLAKTHKHVKRDERQLTLLPE